MGDASAGHAEGCGPQSAGYSGRQTRHVFHGASLSATAERALGTMAT